MSAIAASAFSTGGQIGPATPAWSPISGTSAASGTVAMSWNRRTAEGVAAGGRAEQVALAEQRQHDRGGGEGKADAEHEALAYVELRGPADARGEDGAGDDDLRGTEPEHGAPHQPDALRPQLQPDQEQQHEHAELGDLLDRLDVGDEAQRGRADDGAGDEVAEDRAEAGAPRQRDEDDRGREQVDDRLEHRASLGALAGRVSSSVHRRRRSVRPRA